MNEAPIDEGVSHIELASLQFDQWILTVAIRVYSENQSIKGMVHVVFKDVRGFRYLDEGDLLQYPFPKDCIEKYVQIAPNKGWSQQEIEFGNIATDDHKEYLIATQNECVSVLSYNEPILLKNL